MVDPRDEPVHDAAALQDLAQRRHHVPRLQVPRRRLGQERLVGHVGLGVDDGDADLAPAQLTAQLLLQPQGGVHADVPAADDDDLSRALRSHA
nr:hypothetical protein [Actinomadura madurae]